MFLSGKLHGCLTLSLHNLSSFEIWTVGWEYRNWEYRNWQGATYFFIWSPTENSIKALGPTATADFFCILNSFWNSSKFFFIIPFFLVFQTCLQIVLSELCFILSLNSSHLDTCSFKIIGFFALKLTDFLIQALEVICASNLSLFVLSFEMFFTMIAFVNLSFTILSLLTKILTNPWK